MLLENLFRREISSFYFTRCDYSSFILNKLLCTKFDEISIQDQDTGQIVPPTSCKFSKGFGRLLAIVDEMGGIIILKSQSKGLTSITHEWTGHSNAIFDVDWSENDEVIVTSSGDQSIILWYVETQEKLTSLLGHQSSVTTSIFNPFSKDILASGSRDGCIKLWDLRTKGLQIHEINKTHTHSSIKSNEKSSKKNISKKKMIMTDNNQHSVSALHFQDEFQLISSGSVDGCIKIWDLRKYDKKNNSIPKQIYSCLAANDRVYGITSLALDSSGTRLFASCRNDAVYEFNVTNHSSKPVNTYRHPDFKIFSPYIKIAISKDDNFILSGSSDSNGYIFNTTGNNDIYKLSCHRDEVTSVGWSSGDIGCLVTLSDDCTACIWRNQHSITSEDGLNSVIGSIEKCSLNIPPVTPRKRLVSLLTPVKPRSSIIQKQLPMFSQISNSALTINRNLVASKILTSQIDDKIPELLNSNGKSLILTPTNQSKLNSSKSKTTPNTLLSFFSSSSSKNVCHSKMPTLSKKLFISPKKNIISACMNFTDITNNTVKCNSVTDITDFHSSKILFEIGNCLSESTENTIKMHDDDKNDELPIIDTLSKNSCKLTNSKTLKGKKFIKKFVDAKGIIDIKKICKMNEGLTKENETTLNEMNSKLKNDDKQIINYEVKKAMHKAKDKPKRVKRKFVEDFNDNLTNIPSIRNKKFKNNAHDITVKTKSIFPKQNVLIHEDVLSNAEIIIETDLVSPSIKKSENIVNQNLINKSILKSNEDNMSNDKDKVLTGSNSPTNYNNNIFTFEGKMMTSPSILRNFEMVSPSNWLTQMQVRAKSKDIYQAKKVLKNIK